MFRRLLLLATLAASVIVADGQDGPPLVRVCFFGNSHTYTHDVPGQFRLLCNSTNLIDPMVDSVSNGAVTLLNLLKKDQRTVPTSLQAPDGRPWDILVLQEQTGHSCGAAYSPEIEREFHSGMTGIIDLFAKQNPNLVVILYQTWPHHPSAWQGNDPAVEVVGNSQAAMHQRMRSSYAKALLKAQEHVKGTGVKVLVSPVGDFWVKLMKEQPQLELHNPGDYNHASKLGAYLAASTLLGTAFGKDVLKAATWNGEMPAALTQPVRSLLLENPQIFHQAGK